MSLRTLELQILNELRIVAKNPKLRLKDLLEWRTGPIEPQEGEVVFKLPTAYAAVRKELVKS